MNYLDEEYYDIHYDRCQGWFHEDDLPNYGFCQQMMKKALDAVYKSGNVSELEDSLEELCAQFEIQMEPGAPVLIKQNS